MNETLASLLSSRADERADHPFVSFPDGEVPYGELRDRAAALATPTSPRCWPRRCPTWPARTQAKT